MHEWEPIHISWNGGNWWQCKRCGEFTRSISKPDGNAPLFNIHNHQRRFLVRTSCIIDYWIAREQERERLQYNTHRD